MVGEVLPDFGADGRSGSIPSRRSVSSGPMPERISSGGDSMAPHATVTRPAMTVPATPFSDVCNADGAVAREQDAVSGAAIPDGQVGSRPRGVEVGDGRGLAHAVADVVRHRPGAAARAGVQVVQCGEPEIVEGLHERPALIAPAVRRRALDPQRPAVPVDGGVGARLRLQRAVVPAARPRRTTGRSRGEPSRRSQRASLASPRPRSPPSIRRASCPGGRAARARPGSPPSTPSRDRPGIPTDRAGPRAGWPPGSRARPRSAGPAGMDQR